MIRRDGRMKGSRQLAGRWGTPRIFISLWDTADLLGPLGVTPGTRKADNQCAGFARMCPASVSPSLSVLGKVTLGKHNSPN